MSLKTMELKYTLGRGQKERDGDKEGRKHSGYGGGLDDLEASALRWFYLLHEGTLCF